MVRKMLFTVGILDFTELDEIPARALVEHDVIDETIVARIACWANIGAC